MSNPESASPESASPESRVEIVPGLTNPRALSLDRFPVRTREGSTTRSAWRLEVASDRGAGAIVLVETSAAETFYRGDGVFLGWPQDRMAAAYRALLPKPEDDGFVMQQMG
ncbi:MAG: hypothetical protein ACRD16_02045 [Thermoanaerobaculia bacterium]